MHHRWKGDDVGYISLHKYVKKRKYKPEKCTICKQVKRLELCNISKEKNVEQRYKIKDPIIIATYNRDLKNWFWACIKCHIEYDGRVKNLELGRMSEVHCDLSGKNNPMYGRHHSPKSIAKIRHAVIGRKVSVKSKLKMSIFQKINVQTFKRDTTTCRFIKKRVR